MDEPEIKPVIENIYRVIFGCDTMHCTVQPAHTRVWQWAGGSGTLSPAVHRSALMSTVPCRPWPASFCCRRACAAGILIIIAELQFVHLLVRGETKHTGTRWLSCQWTDDWAGQAVSGISPRPDGTSAIS